MYSLISAPVLGFDLSRLAGGSATAEVLLTACGLTPDDLVTLADHAPSPSAELMLTRSAALDAAAARPSVRELSSREPNQVIALLERAPIGDLSGLLRCLRDDVLDWTANCGLDQETVERATGVIEDVLTSTYLRDLLPDADRRRLAAGWVSAGRALSPVPVDLGPQAEAVVAFTERIRRTTPGEVTALAATADRVRAGGGDWARSMHSATWAVHLSERIRAAAAAQLMLVQAVELARVPVQVSAGGVWNLLSGAAQALVVRDLGESSSSLDLLTPCVTVLGLDWLR
ncbi:MULTISPECIES: hypothetical protein [Actinosynnema]|uniref:Uncharacterized protein n=1 Tax=Actinosynnema pretiosum TaxID=42197 RepID=A0A290Z4E7_9PSEU|nr:hypothetical protein [Actinosynnema pretiosum]ATE53897.1 hypothetical protein CNX65_11815 [Actinosynnema pretiosum]